MMRALPEALVRGERPMVKAEAGQLIYNMQHRLRGRAAVNAFDALKELPGVTERDGQFSIAGQGLSLMIDGKEQRLTSEQLSALLHALPASRLKEAEIMLAAPARYGVRGAVINLRLNHEVDGPSAIQGELYGAAEQTHDASWRERGSLLYNKGKWSSDALYSNHNGRAYGWSRFHSLHHLNNGRTYDIRTFDPHVRWTHEHTWRIGTDYNLAENHQLSIVYNGSYQTNTTRATGSGSLSSTNDNLARPELHDGRVDYTAPFGLKAGAELTYYRDPTTEVLHSAKTEGQDVFSQPLDYQVEAAQRVTRWKLWLKQEHQLRSGWKLNYGTTFHVSSDHSHQHYTLLSTQSAQAPAPASSVQREQNLNIYAGTTKQFGPKLSSDMSVAAEYYHSPVWNRWNLFPTLHFTWMPKSGHTVMLMMSSGKRYPDYWSVKDFTSYIEGGYGMVVGNPSLKPSSSYSAQMIYLLKNKYQFVGWFTHTDNYFVQTPYQRGDTLRVNYRVLNMDFQQQAGVQAHIPLNVCKWWKTNLTLIGAWQRQKDSDFYSLSFDRNVVFCMVNVRNTLTFSKKITMNIDGFFRTKAIQSTFDLPASGNLDLSFTWKPVSNTTLQLYGRDLLETYAIYPRIRYATQNLKMETSCYREIGLSLTWNFGGYTEKKRQAVDRSRLKQ